MGVEPLDISLLTCKTRIFKCKIKYSKAHLGVGLEVALVNPPAKKKGGKGKTKKK